MCALQISKDYRGGIVEHMQQDRGNEALVPDPQPKAGEPDSRKGKAVVSDILTSLGERKEVEEKR